jgi:hypothetical protein
LIVIVLKRRSRKMTEVIEISREGYAAMWFFLGLLTGFLLCPFFTWLGKMLKDIFEK